uniref:Deoxyribonuclease-1-like 1 n=1 Tax=Scleropages formosus TaxID=113540 RepID=A0A8C9VVY1_SCLFO
MTLLHIAGADNTVIDPLSPSASRPTMRIHTSPVLLFALLCGAIRSAAFTICAFNMQSFGDSKAANERIMTTLVRVLSRYDVCLLQEVRDGRGKAIPTLLSLLNRRFSLSPLLSLQVMMKPISTLMWPASVWVEPLFTKSSMSLSTVIGEFVLIPQHTTPSNATKEIDELYDVFLDVKKKWGIEDVMFLGDFNAACGYVAKKNRKNIRLMSEPGFAWLIDDKVDTTVKDTTNCAYDRIVVHGERFLRAIVPNSARPFDFAKDFHLSQEQALQVSDHYPVEVKLKTLSSSGQEQTSVDWRLVISLAVFVISTPSPDWG